MQQENKGHPANLWSLVVSSRCCFECHESLSLRSGHLKLAPGMVSMVYSRRITIFVIRKSLWGFEFSYMSGPAIEPQFRSHKRTILIQVSLFLGPDHLVQFLTSSSPRRFRALFPRVLRHGRLVTKDVGGRPCNRTRPQCLTCEPWGLGKSQTCFFNTA